MTGGLREVYGRSMGGLEKRNALEMRRLAKNTGGLFKNEE